ncbi:zinc finger BED domain-containing protein DAYSLEEPER-like [Rosa rugosa]|uniref:zinc finger BED domain-containing protein DAYSLEEPER-like n=1 Tax=Rosa rugosa TaxID=74645 RepID=UPI002B40FED1|nr:zinc finger BED domain-containing protein DAYSLEEPER-like [Rosa rugosa]
MSGTLQTIESFSSKRRGVGECDQEPLSPSSDSDDIGEFSFQSEAMLEYDEQNGLRAFAKFVCSTQVPPKMVEDADFRELARRFNPSINISVKMVESECLIFYEESKLRIKEFLVNFEGQISLSLEILKYYNYRDYLCLSAHFIEGNWKMKKLVLHFRSASDPEDKSSDNFHCRDWGIVKLLENWGIKDKISTFIMTSGYGSVADCLESQIQGNKDIALNGCLFRRFHVRCCGEMVSLMVQEAFDKIKDIIDKVRALSSSAKSLPLWNHTIFDLQQALKLWSMGEYSTKEMTKQDKPCPSPDEWKKVEGVCKIVGSIYEVSTALFETKHLTANVFLYHLHEFREILTQMTMQSDGFIRTIAEAMLERLAKYWDEMFLLLAITAALDPRFKMKYVEFVCSKVKGDANAQVLAVWGAIQKQFDAYVILFPEKETFPSDSSSSDSDSEGESPIPWQVNHIFSVLQDYHQCIQSSNQPTKKSELDYYLEEPVLPWSQKFSALTWWKTTGAKYPTLSRMARDFLSIPISLATSYDAFYTEPRPVDEHMIRLKPDLANALMCTRSWYRALKEY